MAAYVSVISPDLEFATLQATANDNEAELMMLQAKGALALRNFTDWAADHQGQVLSYDLTAARMRVSGDAVSRLPIIKDAYEKSAGCPIHVGVGTTLSEAEKALLTSTQSNSTEIHYYDPSMDDAFEEKDEPIDFGAMEGSTEPIMEDDLHSLDLPIGERRIDKAEDDGGVDHQSADSQADHQPLTDEEMDAHPDNEEVEPIQIAKECLGKIKQNIQHIEGIKQSDPVTYSTVVEAIKAIQAMIVQMAPPEQSEEGQDEGGEEDSDGGEGGSGVKGPKGEYKSHKEYPVGMVKNGRIKIRLQDGTTRWVSARAGQFAGTATGAPISVKTTKDYGGSNYEGMLDGGQQG